MEELGLPARFLGDVDPKTYTNLKEIKIVVVGDQDVGRSRLLATIYKGGVLTSEEWQDLVPKLNRSNRVHRTFIKPYKIPGDEANTKICLSFWDTTSVERTRFRPFAYTQADMVIILFDLLRKSTLTYPEIFVPDPDKSENPLEINGNIIATGGGKEKEMTLLQEIEYHCPGAPIVLVGNKLDKASESRREVSTTEGRYKAAEIHARQYLEISTVTGEGVLELVKLCYELGFMHKSETVPNIRELLLEPDPVETDPNNPNQNNATNKQQQNSQPSCCCLL